MTEVMQALEERGHQTYLVCRPRTELEAKARRLRLFVYPMKMRSDLGLPEILHIYEFLRRYRIDVVCTNMQKELRFAGVAAKCLKIPVVVWRHIDQPLKNKWRYRVTYNFLATRIVANSNATKTSLLKNTPWLDKERITVIYNGIDPEFYAHGNGVKIRHHYGLTDDTPLIGFVGQLNERKGIQYLLEAFMQVRQEIPGAKLMLVGSGNLRSTIEAFRQNNNCCEQIILAGFQTNIPDFMNAFDLLVLPSLWEGFGYVLVEAMAAGRPVITTNTSSMPEIVRDGVDGLLVPPGEAQSLSQAIIRLLQNPQLAKQMGENGKKHVEEQFTKKRMIDETEACFASVIGRA